MCSFRVATIETHVRPVQQVIILRVILTAALSVGSQVAIIIMNTTIVNTTHLHLTQNINRTHQHGRIGGMVHGLLRYLYVGRLMTGNAFSTPRSSDVGARLHCNLQATHRPSSNYYRGEGSSNLGPLTLCVIDESPCHNFLPVFFFPFFSFFRATFS